LSSADGTYGPAYLVFGAVRTLAVLCAVAVVAGCGGGGNDDASESAGGLSHNGISIGVPPAWDGRVLFTDPGGEGAVIFQVANFALPTNDGLEPPQKLPPGEEDRIKAMAGNDLLLMVSTNQGPAPDRSLPVRITDDSFLPPGSPLIPRGHAIAEEAGCFEGRCVRVTADFATPPSPAQLRDANEILASLAIRTRR
jgi:hypothetical protein